MITSNPISVEDLKYVLDPFFAVRNLIAQTKFSTNETICTCDAEVCFPPLVRYEYHLCNPYQLNPPNSFKFNFRGKRIKLVVLDENKNLVYPKKCGIIINKARVMLDCFDCFPGKRLPCYSGVDITDLLNTSNNYISAFTSVRNCSLVIFDGVERNVEDTVFFLNKELKHESFNYNHQQCVSDSYVRLDTIKIPLICPISKKPIYKPVRGRECQHNRAFDLYFFILSSKQSNCYYCPLCDRHINPLTLVIDADLDAIIKNTDGIVDEVIIDGNGNMNPIVREQFLIDDVVLSSQARLKEDEEKQTKNPKLYMQHYNKLTSPLTQQKKLSKQTYNIEKTAKRGRHLVKTVENVGNLAQQQYSDYLCFPADNHILKTPSLDLYMSSFPGGYSYNRQRYTKCDGLYDYDYPRMDDYPCEALNFLKQDSIVEENHPESVVKLNPNQNEPNVVKSSQQTLNKR